MNRDKLRDLHWTFPWLAGFLGTLGGWSMKWLRRYLLPLIGGLLAWAYGFRRERALRYAVATAIAFSLPYSPERNSWLVIFLVGACYGATPWLLEFRASRSWWPLLTGSTLVGLLVLSAHWPGWTHKWTEGLVFAQAGFLLSWTIDRRRTDA